MGRVLGTLFWIAIAIWAACWWRYDRFADDLVLRSEVEREPVQRRTRMATFDTEQGGVRYQVRPQYDYELYGLVVSKRVHDGQFGLHRLWNDNLNIADLCVVWGSNARALDLNEFSFSSGQFTCYFFTRSRAAWAAFAPARMSDNHLLVDKDWLRYDIDNVEIGDQVRLMGVLAEYAIGATFRRGTSTTRTDTGDGACETIYVQSLQLLQPMETIWRTLYTPAWVMALVSAGLWLFGVLRGRW